MTECICVCVHICTNVYTHTLHSSSSMNASKPSVWSLCIFEPTFDAIYCQIVVYSMRSYFCHTLLLYYFISCFGLFTVALLSSVPLSLFVSLLLVVKSSFSLASVSPFKLNITNNSRIFKKKKEKKNLEETPSTTTHSCTV